jgi:hypothetical protein
MSCFFAGAQTARDHVGSRGHREISATRTTGRLGGRPRRPERNPGPVPHPDLHAASLLSDPKHFFPRNSGAEGRERIRLRQYHRPGQVDHSAATATAARTRTQNSGRRLIEAVAHKRQFQCIPELCCQLSED